MRKILLLAFVFFISFTAFGQDFSNKGKEFWFCFPSHVPSGASLGRLQVWITSDQASSGTVSVTNGSFSAPFVVGANSITSVEIPYVNAHISNAESGTVLQKSIKLQVAAGQPPVVAYLQQFAAARSAATLLLPTSVLGRRYLATSFFQNGTGRSQFQIIATKPNTNVVITPRNNGIVQPVINLSLPNVGDMYQYQSTQDISGSLIESVAGGLGGCNPIAVFSGSSGTSFLISGCGNGGQASVDPLLQQLYPITTWGKNFGFIPLGDYPNGNPYRVMASEDNTNLSINGAVVATLNAGDIFPSNYGSANPTVITQPSSITADKPIAVTQYAQRNSCSGSGHGDPDMVILNPIEQNIKDITIFTSTQESVNRQWINVLIPTVSVPSFRIDGLAPLTPFQVAANIPGYSYLVHQFSPAFNGPRLITADTGFNAICYGFQAGAFESYAYSAGTNVRDLSKELEIETTYGIETSPSVCTNSPFKFKFYIPDSTLGTPPVAIRFDSLRWDLSNPSLIVPNNFPIMVYPPGPPPATVAYDSITIKNGKRVTWYSLPTTYYFNAAGNDTLLVTGYTSTNEGCGTDKLYDFAIVISDPPTASFTAPVPGCYLEPVIATETTPQLPKPTYKRWWEFYDPVTNLTTVYVTSPGFPYTSVSHTFTTPGVKRIRHASITTPGCLSDTIVQNVTLPDIPNATIAGNTTVCINTGTVPVTFTGTDGTAEYIFSYNINGGGTLTTPPSTGGTYTINAPTNVAGPFVYNLVGVTNASPVGTPCTRAITGQSTTVTVLPDHTINLNAGSPNPSLCINTVMPSFTLQLGGGATGIAAPVNLPPGVTATQAGNIVTIAGTPTVAGSYPYSITTTGNACITSTFNGTITVDPDHTIALNGGNANPTLCINTPMPSFSFLLGGGATGIAAPVNLPPGVTATVAGNIVTVAGTPTASGTFNYSITTSGNTCLTSNVTGTIVVDPDHTIAFNGGNPNPTLCVNTVMPSFTLTIGGGATNIAAPVNLPAGVTATVVGNTVTIAGTPTVAGTFNYSITTSGNTCLTATYTGTITVNDDATITLTSASGTNNQTVCINTSITDIDYQVAGGGTGATIAWTPVPAGISFIPLGGNNFRITGIATASGTYNYTISTTGPCIKPQASGTIVVNPDHTIGFNGGNSSPTLCVNTVMPAFTLVIGGGATNIATPAGLPPGVTATVAGNIVTISGTPTSQGSFPYSITTSGNACLTATYSGTITVTQDATLLLTSLAGTDAQELCRNSTIADITYDFGGSATSATVSGLPAGVTWSVTGNRVTITGTPTVSSPVAYTYSVTTVGPCVTPSLTGTILVNALPTAAFTTSTVRCANQDIVFTNTSAPNAASATYDWVFNDPNATVANPNTATTNTAAPNTTHFYLVPNTYTVTLVATNSNGCISDPIASIPVVVNDTPRAGFIVPEVCINDVATVFTDTSSINSGASNTINAWYWEFGDLPSGPLNTSTTQHGSHLYPMPAIYQVTHAAINMITGCTDTIVQPITINAADPVSNFVVSNSCSADSVDLLNQSSVSFGNVTRLDIYWDVVGAPGVFETINVPVFNAVYRHKYPTSTSTQTYTVRMIAYSGNVCFTQSTRPVTVYATPVVQFNNIPNTCYLVAPFQLTQGSEIGGVPGTGTYSGPGITNPNGTFNPQIAGIGTHNIKYTWTASNAGACIDTLTRTITVLDTAHATFSVTLPSCEQTPTLFTNLSTAPASVTLASTVWNFGDATGPQTFAIATPVTHTYANPGTYTVTMHNVSAAGCLSTDTSASITIDANHHITLNGGSNNNQTVCVNTAIAPISYTLSGGATNVTIPALPAGLTYTVAGTPPVLTITGAPASAAGSPYNFSVQTTGNTCLVATTSITITVDPDHVISRNSGDSVQSVCVNTAIDPIVYNLSGGATGAVVANLPPGVTFSITGTLLTISGTPTSTAGSPYNFSIQTTGNSCVKANTLGEIKVNPYPVPAFTFDKTSYCIPNAVVGFINNTTPAPTTLYTYNWDFGDGGTSIAVSPSHLYSSEGPFTVTLKARSTVLLNGGVIGCESSRNNLLDVIHPQPKADFVFSKPAGVCIGDNVLITDATDNKDGLPDKYFWDLGDGTTENTYTFTHTYPDTATYVITMYTVNSFGCNSDTINKLPLVGAPYKPFTVYPYPHVNAGLDKNVLEGGSVQLTATAYGIQPQYAWTPADYLTDSKILQPRVTNPKTDMTYRLTVTGKGGCQLSDDVFVKLLKFPVIANTFSPNGDGINDQWRIDFLNTYPDNRVQIFTRAGKLVFESKGYNTPWDGTLKGKPLPFDTYYYIIEPGNGRDPITGYVTILK